MIEKMEQEFKERFDKAKQDSQQEREKLEQAIQDLSMGANQEAQQLRNEKTKLQDTLAKDKNEIDNLKGKVKDLNLKMAKQLKENMMKQK